MTDDHYNKPAQGTEDWDVPLNENFADLGIEVANEVATWADLPATTEVTQSSDGQWPVYRVAADEVFVRVTDSAQEIIGGLGSADNPLPEQHVQELSAEELSNIAKHPDTLEDIRSLAAEGGHVIDPQQGTYTVGPSSQVELASSTVLVLREGVAIEPESADPDYDLVTNTDQTNGNSAITIHGRGGTVDGDSSVETDGSAVALYECEDSVVEGLNVRDAGFMAVHIKGGAKNTVRDNDVRRSGHHNINVEADDTSVSDNYCEGSLNYDNIQIDEGEGCSVEDNTCRNAGRADITVMGHDVAPDGCSVVGNNCDNRIELGNPSSGGTTIAFSGTLVNDNKAGLIHNRDSSNTTISDNNCWAVLTESGNTSWTLVTGNVIDGDAVSRRGIHLQSDYSAAFSNIVRRTGNYGIQIDATGCGAILNWVLNTSSTAIREASGDSNFFAFNYFNGNVNNYVDASGADTWNILNYPNNGSTTADSMTADPESATEDGYLTFDIGGTTYQTPLYLA